MKSALLLLLFLCTGVSIAAGVDAPVDLNLLDGSHINGKVMSSNGSDLTVMSDFGVLRVAIDKLTPESRQKVTQSVQPDTNSLLKRIAELEAKVTQLQQENASLRKQALSSGQSSFRPSGTTSLVPAGNAPKPAASGAQYTISSTGKRHNSHCRYFGTGRACGPTDGTPCKICGG